MNYNYECPNVFGISRDNINYDFIMPNYRIFNSEAIEKRRRYNLRGIIGTLCTAVGKSHERSVLCAFRVFLVRESKSNPGAYVLTYKYSDKIFHAQIQPVSIPRLIDD